MTIEWTEPMPCSYGRRQRDGMEIVGIIDGLARFTLQALGHRSARLLDMGEFVCLTAGEEIGESHVEHLKDVAESVLEYERART